MKKVIAILLLLLLAAACRDATGPNKRLNPKMVPDHTPYIAGLIQYSPDTTFHCPEVVVGYFTDHQVGNFANYRNAQDKGLLVNKRLASKLYYPSLYNLILTHQLTTTSVVFSLSWQPESHAVVTVSGPLGTPQEKQVTFTSEGHGVYGDVNNALPRMKNGRYKLHVTLPEGQKYVAKTYIPDSAWVRLPDSISVPVVYRLYNNGAPREENPDGYPYLYNPPQNGYLAVVQWNSNRDRQMLFLKQGQKFLYSNYGNYLRKGVGYYINLTSNMTNDTLHMSWQQLLNKPLDEVWSSQHWWMRYSFFSQGISKMFFPHFTIYATSLKYSETLDTAPEDSALANDTHYLHNVSTILKVGKNGKVLPKDSSDAIGFFAGEYSRYLQTTLYANRQFDLDSLLKAWNNRNE